MPFSFNAVGLCVVIINGKPWTRAKEVCMALEYKKGRTRNVLKKHVSIENKQHKHELEGYAAAARPLEWPKKSQPDDSYVSEEGMYELLFLSQQSKARDFRKHCFNVLFPHVQQQLTNKMKEEKDNQIQALEFTNEKYEQKTLKLNEEIVDLIKNRSWIF